jgi:hypothetical protein
MNLWLCLMFLVTLNALQAEEIKMISLPLISNLQRTDIYILKLTPHPTAILVLSPGFNGNGKDWITNPDWQDFARHHNLSLVGLSFASDAEKLQKGQGYYYPAQGSGQLLLDGISQAFNTDIPLLLYGFSGGAHFTSGFSAWKPERVLGWCAYSAEWWEKPYSNRISPPGLVICGDKDERYGASLTYFKQGRALGKPWLWVSVSNDGHSISARVEGFVRDYFAAILDAEGSTVTGQWVDIDLKKAAPSETVSNEPSLVGWLPNDQLFSKWDAVHQP